MNKTKTKMLVAVLSYCGRRVIGAATAVRIGTVAMHA